MKAKSIQIVIDSINDVTNVRLNTLDLLYAEMTEDDLMAEDRELLDTMEKAEVAFTEVEKCLAKVSDILDWYITLDEGRLEDL